MERCETRYRAPGKGVEEHFKLASLAKPEFPEIMASVDLTLYKMKGNLKRIKPAY